MPNHLRALAPENIACGLRVRLLALEAIKSKWTTVLVGARAGRYLIVEMPSLADGGPVRLDVGTRWAVNFIHNGFVYNFNSEVLGCIHYPARLLFIRYPDEVEAASLRQEKRYPVSIPALWKMESTPESFVGAEEDSGQAAEARDWTEPVKALVVDISEKGCMLASTVSAPESSILRLTLYLPHGVTLENVMAAVKIRRSQAQRHYLGLAFDPGTSQAAAAALVDLINGIENSPLRI